MGSSTTRLLLLLASAGQTLSLLGAAFTKRRTHRRLQPHTARRHGMPWLCMSSDADSAQAHSCTHTHARTLMHAHSCTRCHLLGLLGMFVTVICIIVAVVLPSRFAPPPLSPLLSFSLPNTHARALCSPPQPVAVSAWGFLMVVYCFNCKLTITTDIDKQSGTCPVQRGTGTDCGNTTT